MFANHLVLLKMLGIGLVGGLVYLLSLLLIGVIVGAPLQWFFERRRARRLADLRARNLLAPWSRVLGRMRRMRRPTLLLIPARAPGFSKIGGQPELPAGLAWPQGVNAPRVFVAQVDLAAFQAHAPLDWLPREGRFYAFFDEERGGSADLVSILYSLEIPGPEQTAPQPVPAQWRFRERRVAFMLFRSLPSLDWLEVDLATLDDEPDRVAAAEDELNPYGDEIEHRIGGYPSEIQSGQMAIECEYLARGLKQNFGAKVPDPIRRAARQWRLLLQIDSDPGIGMCWWDTGRLYVFIRERDARAGDFSRTVTISQTC